MTNNNGACYVDDCVIHEFCLINKVNNGNIFGNFLPGLEPNFDLSYCQDRCSNDPSCKGYSKQTINYTLSFPPYNVSYDTCYLFTTSNASRFCTHNYGGELQSDANITVAVGPLDPKATCNVTNEGLSGGPGVISASGDFYEGCYIKVNNKPGKK